MIKLVDTDGNVVYVNVEHISILEMRKNHNRRDQIIVKMISGSHIWVTDEGSIHTLVTTLMGQ